MEIPVLFTLPVKVAMVSADRSPRSENIWVSLFCFSPAKDQTFFMSLLISSPLPKYGRKF